MKIRIVVLLVLVGIAAAVWRFGVGREKSQGLVFSGNVDIREVNLGFRVAGRLEKVLKDEGDVVKAGEVLAVLEDAPYRRELQEAQARAAAAKAQLDLMTAGHRPEEIAQARAAVQEREATLANARLLLERQEKLLQGDAVSLQERDNAQARFTEAEARLQSARDQLRLLEAGFRIEEIEAARADLGRAEAAVASARLRLDDTQIKAPSDGVILTRAQEPGAILQSGMPVLTLSLQSPVWVRAYVSEPQAGQIHSGMPVAVYTDSRTQPYKGQIGYISPRAEFTPKQVETTELRTSLVYRFRVVVENPDEGLRQGMPVTVKPM